MPDIFLQISEKAQDFFGKIDKIEELPPSGSSRRYFRLCSAGQSIIAAYNTDLRENTAFVYFSSFFKEKEMKVPTVLRDYPSEGIYFLEDLGDQTLFQIISHQAIERETLIGSLYPKILGDLIHFQKSNDFDPAFCYPHSHFDRRSMMWDLNYFKYFFLKLNYISFNENALENDFEAFTEYLSAIPSNYFMFRDFQSRNVMIKEGVPFYIDFQGGRYGPLQYDVASLLFDAKAGLQEHERQDLLSFYCKKLEESDLMRSDDFMKSFYHIVAIRIMQAMGAYGYRGYYERKPHFLQSVPLAIENLNNILPHIKDSRWPELSSVWKKIVNRLQPKSDFVEEGRKALQIEIQSISLKKRYPDLHPEHGGGFVFDCRFLPNPGRIEKYKHLNGTDLAVARYLKQQPEVEKFINDAYTILRAVIQKYRERDFELLSITFGCTGGQHRSVYCAEAMRKLIISEFSKGVEVSMFHCELHKND